MELRDLTHEERLALVALLELVIESDHRGTEGEVAEVDRVVEALGREEYEALVEEVDRRFATEDELRAFLPSIVRQEARELIYGTALDTAIEDAVDVWESSLLDWLAKLWNVTVDFEGGAPEGD
jgi:arginine utilization protein RocB